MIGELGHFALVLACVISLIGFVLPFIGAQKGWSAWMRTAWVSTALSALLATVALGALTAGFVTSDFSILNVARHSNMALPLAYKVAAVWGSHEGSILFWVTVLTWWSLAVAISARHLPERVLSRILGTLSGIAFGLFLFITLTSNPFLRLFPPASNGADLNPLLQDPGMIFHPPLLYLGYVGFAVPFAFAIAALLGDRLDVHWARWMRPWTTMSWVLLTLGISLGSYWSYYELGWGGWWAWDPVENSSFMPWLTGTALMHSLAVTEKRGCFRIWTVLLAILSFSLSLLGTFLVRSGVLTSVHAFASDPERGIFILGFLIIVIGLSFLLFAWRAPTVGLGGNFGLISRESMLLVNNVLLVVAMGAVLLGTLYPLFLDALNAGKISVGPPYFDAVFGPLMIPLVFLIGIGPLARWKAADPKELTKMLWWCLALAIAAGVAIPFAMGEFGTWVFVGCTSAVFVFACVIEGFRQQIRHAKGNLVTKLLKQPRSYWGMQLAHVGVAVFIIGVALVKGYSTERDVHMFQGEQVTVDGYTFTLNGISSVRGPNYTADRGDFTLERDGKVIQHLYPEKRKYFSSNNSMPMTEAAIRHSITGDVYVSLGAPTSDGGWVVRAYSKPFVTWIWFGAMIMAFGGFWAATDRRYRRKAKRATKEEVED